MSLDVRAVLPEPPEVVRDGDCDAWSIRVTEALAEHGHDSVLVYVWGYLDLPGKLLGFVHRATWVPGIERIVDFTARQFDPSLPGGWVVDPLEYCLRLAGMTGVEVVTISNQESGANMSPLSITCMAESGDRVAFDLGEFDSAAEAAEALIRIGDSLGSDVLRRHLVRSALMHRSMGAVEWLAKYRVVAAVASVTS